MRDMDLTLIGGSAHPALTAAVARACGTAPARCLIERFPDGELHVDVAERVRDDDVYVVQPTCPPVDQNLMELLLLSDACRRAGAARITAVVPYFGYARQDRRARGREPLSARLVADLLAQAGVGRLVAIDLHAPSLEGCCSFPLEHMTAVPLLADAVEPMLTGDTIIVAPDLGAVKLAEKYARRLRRPVAIVHKTRLSGLKVEAGAVIGDVRQRNVLIVDDMITTGSTIEAATRAVLAAGAREQILVVATHLLLVGNAAERLARLPLQRVLTTDTVPSPHGDRVGVASLLAETILTLHHGASIGQTGAHA